MRNDALQRVVDRTLAQPLESKGFIQLALTSATKCRLVSSSRSTGLLTESSHDGVTGRERSCPDIDGARCVGFRPAGRGSTGPACALCSHGQGRRDSADQVQTGRGVGRALGRGFGHAHSRCRLLTFGLASTPSFRRSPQRLTPEQTARPTPLPFDSSLLEINQ